MSKKKKNEVNINEDSLNDADMVEEKVEDIDGIDDVPENNEFDDKNDAISEEMYERDMDEDDIEDQDDEAYEASDEDKYDISEENEDDNSEEEGDYIDDDDFLEEDPYVIKLDNKKKSTKNKKADNKEKSKDKSKSDDRSIKGLALLFAWLVFVLLVVVFYFYFMDKLPFFNKDKNETTTEALDYEITYETNAHEDINKLISDYYQAMAACDQATLQSLVVDASVFDDMRFYEEKQKVMTEYKNINVYTLPGYFTGDYVAYVTYDSVIVDVNSPLADIQCYYISNTDKGYKINNTKLDPAIVTYMNEQLNQADIQGLYKSVKDKVDECLELDPTFKAFYDNLINNTTEEE